MSAVFLESKPYTVSATGAPNAPAHRLLLDEPGLVYRSTGKTAVLDITGNGYLIADTIALMGAKLNSNDAIRIQAGTSSGDLTLLDHSTTIVAAYARNDRSTCYLPLPYAVSAPFYRITITTTRDVVEVSRLLIGERIEVDGIDYKPTFTPVSGSTIEDGPGWTTVGPQRTRHQWKCSVGNIKAQSFYREWAGFMERTGKHTGFLFIPNTESVALQYEAILARHQQDPSATQLTPERWQVDLQLLEV